MKEKIPTYLFVCLANMNRSPTAEDVFRGLVKSKGKRIRTNSAGLSYLSKQPINNKLAKEADIIFVMEKYMKDQLEQLFRIKPGKIIVLNIPDIYERDDPVLIKILLDVLESYLEAGNKETE